MTAEKAYPAKAQSGQPGQSGMDAVKAAFGEDMVAHMRSEPRRLYNEALAEFGNPWDAEDMKAKSEEWLARCEQSRDYALAQAGAIARRVPRDAWGAVMSVEQNRKQTDDRENEAAAYYAARGVTIRNPHVTPKPITAPVPSPPPFGGDWKGWLHALVGRATKDAP